MIMPSSILASFNRSFTTITADSRQVQAGSLFLAYPGAVSDGRDYIAQAIQKGASAIVWEQAGFAWSADWNVSNLAVAGLKNQVGQIAAEYYQYPSEKLTMIGVTGTNGKTSVSQWLAQCLSMLGKKSAVLGTIGNGLIDSQATELAEAANTTPDAILLQCMLAGFVVQQADAVVMEVSSHGLDQGRVNGVAFDIAVLTNLSRDHLDYHATMEAYAAAKQKLFDLDGLNAAVLNADDVFGQAVASSLSKQGKAFLTYGLQHGDVRGSQLILHDAGISMNVTTPNGDALLTAPVLGRFNAYNVLAVLATLLALEVSLNDAIAAIGQIKPVAGRMQQFGGGALPLVVVDYAHTPDALEKVLSTLREQLQTEAKLICVFGCGGNRDTGKRPLMGAIAAKLADTVIVTSDNPRSEDAGAIIHAIIGDKPHGYLVEADRASAINTAIQLANKGDIVLVAGKGHENYQEILGVKYPFDDALLAQDALNKRAVNNGVLNHNQAKSDTGVSL
jgi:UDP-N-acetylmuramyl-tripeptide synthetase